MITDVQLAIFANALGVGLFLLVVLYHYVAVNHPKKLDDWRALIMVSYFIRTQYF